MKKLMFVAASFALVTSAFAADGTETKFSGELRMRYFGDMNESMAVSGSESNDSKWQQRSKLGAMFSKGEDLSAQVTLLHQATWGVGTPNGIPTQGNVNNDVMVYEAWGFWKAMNNFSLRMGRGAFQVADGTVISTNDWQQNPEAFEGVLGTWYTDFANVNVLAVKAFDTVATDKPEVNFYGVSVDVKNLPEALKMVNVHVLQINELASGQSESTMRYGLTVGGAMSGFDYRGTYAGLTGKDKATTPNSETAASMMDLEGGYTFEDFMKARVSVLYHSDTGDDSGTTKDEEYDGFHYEKHYNAGLMDVVEWGNLNYIKAGISLEPMEMTTVGLDYYMFNRTEETQAFTTTTGLTGTGTDKAIGSEIDFYANKKYDNGMTVGARYGVFTPGDHLKGATDRKAFSQAFLEAKMNF